MSIRKPMILVIAGPNGSGKSTFTQYFEKIGEYTNADDVVAATGMDNAEAARWVDKKRYEAIAQKRILPLKQYYPRNTSWISCEKPRLKDTS